MRAAATQEGKETSGLELHGEVAVLRFPRVPLFAAADMHYKRRMLHDLAQAWADPAVRALVLWGAPDKAGREEYASFVLRASERDDRYLFKMLNAFNQILLEMVRSPKPLISVESGLVLSQFLHMSLACDYRLLGENTVFQKAYFAENLLPKGGGAFFLRRMLGTAKAFEVLTSEEDMSAGEALALGLVHEVVPMESLERVALERARKLARVPAATLAGIKRLLIFPVRELEEYLEAENEELYRAYVRGKHDRSGG